MTGGTIFTAFKQCLCLLVPARHSAADFEAALSFPKPTENQVFRDRVQANWLPDGKTFWYRVQQRRGRQSSF